jgi:capsular polysaccharide biosynthesis protein
MATSSRARRFGTLLIAAGALVLLAAASAWYFFPVQYEAYALLKVASKPPAVLGQGPVADVDFAIFKRTQVQLMLSSVVLNGTLREPAIFRLSMVQAHRDDPVSWLKGQLIIDYPDDAEIMRIALKGKRRDEAIKLVDQVVDVYLKEIVQHDKQMRLDNEEKLRRAYEKQSADYQKELDALRTLEQIHKTSGSEAAQLKKKMVLEDLEALLAQRRELRGRIDENDLDIMMARVRAENPVEARTADSSLLAKIFPSDLPLKWLEQKDKYLQERLVKIEESIAKTTDELAALESFSAQVAAKQEDLNQLRLIKNQLGAELDRIQVERLAPDRITKLDNAVIANSHGDAVRRNVTLSLAAALGLALIALGLVIRLQQR